MFDLNKEIRSRIFFQCAITSLCMLLVMYLKFHLDYDRFHSKHNRIYIVTSRLTSPNETATTSLSSWKTASTIKSRSRFVEQTTRLSYSQLKLKENSPVAINGLFADASIFEIFDLPLISGNKKTALNKPLSIVLTQRAANQLFGHNNPLGKSVFLEDFNSSATVTAIAKNIHENSQIKADAFISMPTLAALNDLHRDNDSEAISVITYLLLKPNVSAKLALESLSNSISTGSTEKRKLLSTNKEIILKPLRATLVNPILTRFQILLLFTSSLISFLILFASIKRVTKIFLLQMSLSAEYMTISLKQRSGKLAWKVCSVTTATYLFSYFISICLMVGLKHIFDIEITENPYPPCSVGVGMPIILVISSIFLSLWIAYRVPNEPITTYLILKKEH